MCRVMITVCAVVLAVGPARAADPKPLWEIDTAQPKVQTGEVTWLGFSPDGKTLVAILHGIRESEKDVLGWPKMFARLVAWNVTNRKEKWSIDLGDYWVSGHPAQTCAITDDGCVLVPGHVAQEVRLTDGKATKLKGVPTGSARVWFDPKSRRAAWLVRPYDLPDLAFGQLPALGKQGERAAGRWTSRMITEPWMIDASAFSPDGRMVLLAGAADDESGRGCLKPWTLTQDQSFTPGELVNVPDAHRGPISRIGFSPDGKTVALGSRDSVFSLWDITKPQKDWKPYATITAGKYGASCLTFSPDGRTLAAATSDRKGKPNLFMIDVRGGKLVTSHALGDITALAYSLDGKWLVTGESVLEPRGCKIRVWDAAALRGE